MAGRFRTLALTVLVVLLGAGILLPQSGDSERAYSPEGAWLGTATMVPSGFTFPITDIYTSNSTTPTNAGTVLCTTPPLKIPIFAGGEFQYYAAMVPTGSGNWVRVDKNKAAVTVWRILLNQQTGAIVGRAMFWGTLTLEEQDQAMGALQVQFYDLAGTPIAPRFEAMITESRIGVEGQERP